MPRHHSLDLIRGLAALGVATYHFLSWNYGVEIYSMGDFGVYTFFILSAVTMMMIYGERFRDGISPDTLKIFFQSRAARLLPLLAAVSIVYGILAYRDGLDTVPNLITRVALTGSGLFSLHLPQMLASSLGTWSLGIEVMFYLLFPIIAIAASRCGICALIAATVMLALAQHALLEFLQPILEAGGPGAVKTFRQAYITPLAFAPLFAIGILIYRLGGSRHRAFAAGAVLTLLGLMSYSLVIPGRPYDNHASYFVLSCLAAVSVYFAWRGTLPVWLKKPTEFLGEVSYSLYLTHWVTNIVVNKATNWMALSPILHFCLFLATGLSVSWMTYRYFERPLRDHLRGDHGKVATLP